MKLFLTQKILLIKPSAASTMSGRFSRTIYVGNLPLDVRESEIDDLFYKVGGLFSLSISRFRGSLLNKICNLLWLFLCIFKVLVDTFSFVPSIVHFLLFNVVFHNYSFIIILSDAGVISILYNSSMSLNWILSSSDGYFSLCL